MDLLPDQQHGFRSNRSCLTNLIDTMDYITKSIDTGIPIDELFLDFSKAFDKVPHRRLIYKLQKLGITDTLLSWIESFLSNRSQRVTVKGKCSLNKRVTSGVPQGSVLGPLLFICFIIDLPDAIKHSMSNIFADDTKLYKQITSPEDADELQMDINSLYEWCITWGMSFNTTKCFIMHYGKANAHYIYHINGNILSNCDTYKDLGVLTSKDLKVHAQLKSCIAKANSIVGMIRRTFTYIDGDLLTRTFKVFVRPILEYCQQVWCEVSLSFHQY